jgi:apolipoprotein N-acyltransferase
MAAAQSYPGWGWLTLGALVPLCLVLEGWSFLAIWAILAVFNGIYTALTAHWIRLTGQGFGWFLLAAVLYEMVLVAIPAAGVWIAGKRRGSAAWILVLPALWTLMEMLSRRVFFGVSWALLGLPLADYPGLAQIAAVAAPEVLSFLVIAVNVAIAMAFQKRAKSVRWATLLQGAGLLIAALAFGTTRLSSGPEPTTAKIAVVQPMLSQLARWDRAETRPPLLSRMDRLVDRAAAGSPQLIVLPEAALPGLVRYEQDLAQFVTRAVERTATPLLFGSVDRDEQGRIYNVAVRIGTDGTVSEYRKTRLVPFVEHTPWPFHYKPADGWVQFAPGTERTLMPLNAASSFSVAMCLEDTYPDIAREYVLAGSNLLIALVNTENFKETNQALAHLRRARLTAVAAGLPMVRAANSGFSCSIDARGRLLGAMPPNAQEAGVLPASPGSVSTVYDALGDMGVGMLLIAFLGLETLWLRVPHQPIVVSRRGDRKRRSPASTTAM